MTDETYREHVTRWLQRGQPTSRVARTRPTSTGQFRTIAEIKAANRALGHYWFDKDTMDFFDSRVESGVLLGHLFITSERLWRFVPTPRRYTIRSAAPDGAISTVGEFQAYESKEAARQAIKVNPEFGGSHPSAV